MIRSTRWIAVLVAACNAACVPTLDWREFVPEGSGIGVTFPCRPDRHARNVTVAGERASMEMIVCSEGGATFAVAFLDVADPGRVSPALRELKSAALGNVHGANPRVSTFGIKNMTPNDESTRLSIDGRLPDGSAVREEAAFFVHGLRVYQATVIGARPEAQGVETFFGGLKFPG